MFSVQLPNVTQIEDDDGEGEIDPFNDVFTVHDPIRIRGNDAAATDDDSDDADGDDNGE